MSNSFDEKNNRVQWQINCDNVIKDKDCVILSSPTGSGKTKRYENWAFNKAERPIFITSPVKALSNQRFRELLGQGYRVALETGDIKYFPYEDCDIICCTQEIYNNRYRDYENSTLVIDEFSYIFEDDNRARVYIDSLYHSKAKNIMLCSATFGNPVEVKEYINRLTGKSFFLYENKDRLTSLDYMGKIKRSDIVDSLVVAYTSKSCEAIAKAIYEDRTNKAKTYNLYNSYDPRKSNKKEIMAISEKYDINNKEILDLSMLGVAYYFGSLLPKEKLFIEELFEKRLIDTVVGTDSLALGVNFPIKNVVFTQLKKMKDGKIVPVSKNLFEQLSGRAGRKGFFDNGFVYCCDDFSKDYYGYIEKYLIDDNLEQEFYKLTDNNNEDANISLTANIKDILNGIKTIEDEALFIVQFSTEEKDFFEEYANISQKISYIKSFDIVDFYLRNKFVNLDFSLGYNEMFEGCSPKIKDKFDRFSNKLMLLQPVFDRDIGKAYLPEFSPKKNCSMFVDVLMDVSMQRMIKRYGRKFSDLLLLRKYIANLPDEYSNKYDLDVFETLIDSIDYTVLHPTSERLKKNNDCNTKKEEIPKTIKSYICPNYFDRVLVGSKEYVKLLTEKEDIVLCDYSNKKNLKIYFLPTNANYKLMGFIKNDERVDILNRLDFSSLEDNDPALEKIKGMQLYLKKNNRRRR